MLGPHDPDGMRIKCDHDRRASLLDGGILRLTDDFLMPQMHTIKYSNGQMQWSRNGT